MVRQDSVDEYAGILIREAERLHKCIEVHYRGLIASVSVSIRALFRVKLIIWRYRVEESGKPDGSISEYILASNMVAFLILTRIGKFDGALEFA